MAQSQTTAAINWKKQLRESFLIFLIGIPWGYMMCPNCDEFLIHSMAISGFMWLSLWKGNEIVSHFVDKRYTWLDAPVKRLISGIVAHIVFTIAIMWLIVKLFEVVLNIEMGDIWLTIQIGVAVTLLMTLILQSREFLISWRQVAVDHERMMKEAISAKYETLKNQVNPHFLFNSLNTLTNLVFEDQEMAARFIKKLSEVYRYVLEARDKELVTIQEEMAFVESFVFLQKLRHESGLNFQLDVATKPNEKVPPMAVQMLVENAIKHNVVSDEDPLNITITKSDDLLVVENNLQLKNIVREDSNGVGLANIKSRYQFLSEKPVSVNKTENKFIVELPIIDKA